MTTTTLTETTYQVKRTPGNDGFNSKPTSFHGQIHRLLLQDSVTLETPLTMAQIVAALKLEKSRTKYNHLNDCKDRGWVSKVRGKDGKEGYILTDVGRQLLLDFQPISPTESHMVSEPSHLTESNVQSEPDAMKDANVESEPSPQTETLTESEPTSVIESHNQSEPTSVIESHNQSEPTSPTESQQKSEPKHKKERKPRTRKKKA